MTSILFNLNTLQLVPEPCLHCKHDITLEHVEKHPSSQVLILKAMLQRFIYYSTIRNAYRGRDFTSL